MTRTILVLLIAFLAFGCKMYKNETFMLKESTKNIYGKVGEYKAFVYRNDDDSLDFDTLYVGGFSTWIEYHPIENPDDGHYHEHMAWYLTGTGDIDSIVTDIDARRQGDWQDWRFFILGKTKYGFSTYEKTGSATVYHREITDTTINGKTFTDVFQLRFLLDQKVDVPGPIVTNYYHTYYWSSELGLLRYEYHDSRIGRERNYTLIKSIK